MSAPLAPTRKLFVSLSYIVQLYGITIDIDIDNDIPTLRNGTLAGSGRGCDRGWCVVNEGWVFM